MRGTPREGFYEDDYAIEARTRGTYHALAFRVRDKANYYLLTWIITDPTKVRLSKIVDGQETEIASPSIPQLSPVSWQRWRIWLSGDDLGLWLKVNDQSS